MINEEKAEEIANNESLYVDTDNLSKADECRIAAMTMAKWKDEQLLKEKQALIDKSCKWLECNSENYMDTQNDSEGYVCEVFLYDDLISDFRKVMEE